MIAFGKALQNTTLNARFTLTNRHDFPVKIHEVITNCDCVETTCSTYRLAPGAQAVVATSWDTRTRHGRSQTEIIVKFSSAAGGPPAYHYLTLEADVEADFNVDPLRLRFDSGTDDRLDVAFSPARDPGFRISRAYSTHSAFQADLLDDQLRVSVHFDPSRWRGDGDSASLVVETNSKAEPTFRVPLVVAKSAPSPESSTTKSEP